MAAGRGLAALAGALVGGAVVARRRRERERTDDTPVGDAPPSLDLVVEVTRFERELQVQQLDAKDAKAGTQLGFAGLLVALIATLGGSWFLVPGAVAAGIAAVLALGATQSTKFRRIAPEDAYAWWANESRDRALWQAYADEVGVLRHNDGVVKAKLKWVKWTWRVLTSAVVLVTVGILAEAVSSLERFSG